MIQKASVVSLVLGASFSGCAPSQAPFEAPGTSSVPKAKQAQSVVDALTGNARGSRNEARALHQQSNQKRAAGDYEGAMKLRWQMLGIRGGDVSPIGGLSAYAIQSLALGDLAPIAAHLSAASCRRFADQLADFDARSPTYAAMLESKKASEIKLFAAISKDPQNWRKTIADLHFSAPERQNLEQTSAPQIQANIENLYNAEIRQAARPYAESLKPNSVAVDPYTRNFASPSPRQRFLHAKFQTQRLLVVAALRKRAAVLERSSPLAMPADPFGGGALKQNGVIYSVGPDAKDDGGASVPAPERVQAADQGDIRAPSF